MKKRPVKVPPLKCCPMCGGTAEYHYSHDNQSFDEISIRCTRCGLTLLEPNTRDFFNSAHDDVGNLTDKAEKLISEWWNKRV